MTGAAPLSKTAYRDDARLVAALWGQGVRHLSIAEPASSHTALDTRTLIARLAGHVDPRLREALIPLFLRQPDLATAVSAQVQHLPPADADALRHLYTAAVYLQRLWLTTLRMHLGDFPLLPDHFGQAHYHLPAPAEKFGEAGLQALAELYETKTGLDWLSVYQSTMNLFLQQLGLEQRHG